MNRTLNDDPLHHVTRLARLAKREAAPRGHVTREVLRRIRHKNVPSLTRPLTLFAAVAAGAAVAALVLIAASVSTPVDDPFGAFFQVTGIGDI